MEGRCEALVLGIGNVLWAFLVFSLVLPLWRGWQQKKAQAAEQFGEER